MALLIEIAAVTVGSRMIRTIRLTRQTVSLSSVSLPLHTEVPFCPSRESMYDLGVNNANGDPELPILHKAGQSRAMHRDVGSPIDSLNDLVEQDHSLAERRNLEGVFALGVNPGVVITPRSHLLGALDRERPIVSEIDVDVPVLVPIGSQSRITLLIGTYRQSRTAAEQSHPAKLGTFPDYYGNTAHGLIFLDLHGPGGLAGDNTSRCVEEEVTRALWALTMALFEWRSDKQL